MNYQFKILKLCVAGIFSVCFPLTPAKADTYNYSFSPNRVVPDGDFSGVLFTANLTGMTGYITDVTISLNITGGFNGDLYAYLAGPQGGFAVLLNRPGVANGDGFGYDNTGFNITLSDSSSFNNLHNYQNVSYTLNGNGQLMGNWEPDGRAIDPMAAPALFDSTAPSALLDSFNNTLPNGTWSLLVADVSDGGQSVLANWGLDIETVPEPAIWPMLGIGAVIFLGSRRLTTRRR